MAEASGENIFIVRRGKLKTPPLSSAILEGITRDTVITLAREVGLVVEESTFARDELYLADEVFFTGTAAELTPVREIDDRKIGAGECGPVTRAAARGLLRGGQGTRRHGEALAPGVAHLRLSSLLEIQLARGLIEHSGPLTRAV